MATPIELAPDPHLLESMRAVGYTVETAIADLIDNSIAAGASKIHVLSTASGPPRVGILDDGSGMTRESALDAMRLASQSPSTTRAGEDLGRFGLGLKTASLSQCRRLTVATKREGQLTILRWDLDHVMESGAWEVLELSPADASCLIGWSHFEGYNQGTLVAWEELDLFSMTEGQDQRDFDAAMVRVRAHCELVFHRFASGDGVRNVDLTFNGTSIDRLDPFLRTSKATQRREERIRIGGVELPVHSYTLPFINKMSPAQKRKAMTTGSLRDSQGFYIYRGGRLVIWGTWFRLNPKSEMGKLARVQVDVPNSLDSLWALDIKKSQATPPREMRDALRNLATQMIAPSRKVQSYRGRALKGRDDVTRFWELVTERDKEFRYTINREHPAVRRLAEKLDEDGMADLDALLSGMQSTFPVLDAHNRLSEDAVSRQNDLDEQHALSQARALREAVRRTYPDDDEFIKFLCSAEPYSDIAGFAGKYKQFGRGV